MISEQITIAAGQTVNIAPSISGEEWIVHNIYIPMGSTIALSKSDGSISVEFMKTSNSLLSYSFHCKSTSYINITNNDASAIYASYDGIISME